MNKVRIGVVGLGKMGRFHINVINQIDDIILSGVYDIDNNSSTEISSYYDLKSFESIDALLNESDALIIASPTITHFEISKKAIEKGKHVLVEKPMTETFAQALELSELIEKHKVIFQVGHVERFNGAVRNLKRIVDDPILIETRRLSPFSDRITDVGVIFDIMIHDIDIVTSFVGKPVISYHASGKRIRTKHEDVASALLEFENNTVATISASRITEEKIRTLSISSSDAYFILDYATQDITIHRQATSKSNIKLFGGINYRQESTIERVFVHRDNPLKLEVTHFAKCILKEETPLVSIEDDLKTLRITEGILNEVKRNW